MKTSVQTIRRSLSCVLSCITILTIPLNQAAELKDPLDAYNVIWDSPSQNSSGSMPLGNGEVGVNLWVEPSGDILFYISRGDAWDEHARLVKLGRVRLRLNPNPLARSVPYRQELRLRRGEAVIRISDTEVRFWVDANHPIIWVEIEGAKPMELEASVELWRTELHPAAPAEASAVDGFAKGELPMVYPDTIASTEPGDQVIWYHRNAASLYPTTLKVQGLESLATEFADPLLGRTFGAILTGSGFRKSGPLNLKSAQPSKRCVLAIASLTTTNQTPAQWLEQIGRIVRDSTSIELEVARSAHQRWWSGFWDRSWMRLSGGETNETEQLSIGWHLNRYQNACAGRGKYPLKFNGSIFNVDGHHPANRTYAGYKIAAGTAYSADFREWGGCYWFQNTRHMYWPMLAAGDFDLMEPLFRMYREMLPFAVRRTQLYYGHEGAFFPETLYFWGAYFNDRSLGYGWDREGQPHGLIHNGYTRYYWQGGLELITMMLDYATLTGDLGFVRETVMPLADSVTTFYDHHYSRDAQGKLRFEPANALETFWDVGNPVPEIAGLERVFKGVLNLPLGATSDELHRRCRRLLNELPPYPVKEKDGHAYLDAAEIIRDKAHNAENVALWALFPYRIFGLEKPQLEMIRTTYNSRPFRNGYGCWGNDNTSAAYVGLAAEARKHLAERFVRHGQYRFPVFYSNGDWTPDLDNGGNAQQALQAMLMQADDRKILLFPAWPKEWNVDFKLHAPLNTTVEGRYRDGVLRGLKVTPAERKADLIELTPQ